MICVKTFEHKYSSDFKTWDDWVLFVNQNKTTDLKGWKGKCKTSDLPSNHPYWKLMVKIEKRKILHNLIDNYENCKKYQNKIKYIFNKNTSLEDIKKKIEKLKDELYS